MAIIPANTRELPQVNFRPSSARPQRVIAFNASLMRAIRALDTSYTHVALDHDRRRHELRFVFLSVNLYRGTPTFRLLSEGSAGRTLAAPSDLLDDEKIPYGRFPAEIQRNVAIVRYGKAV